MSSEPEDELSEENSQPATGPETVVALIEKSGRKNSATPIRRSFVQPLERQEQPGGGPLARLVARRDQRALVLYLMVLTLATKEPWDVRRHSRIWARVLDMGGSNSAPQAVSKAWKRLREVGLVHTERDKRLTAVTILREDGSNKPYTYPDPTRRADRYLRLPFAFWLDGWYQKLSLPAMAMMLVLLAEKDGVVLPLDRVPDWYGISRATAQRGLKELEDQGLLRINSVRRTEPLAPDGFTFDRHLTLIGPLAKPAKWATAPASTTGTESKAKRRRRRRKTVTKKGEEVKNHGS